MKKTGLNKVLLIVVSFLLTWSAFGQQAKIENLIYFDQKDYHFGFFLGANQMLYTVKTKIDFENKIYTQDQIPEMNADQARLLNIGAAPTLGFTVGIIADKRMGNYFNLRIVPDLQFGERLLVYDLVTTYRNELDTILGFQKRVPSTLLNFPIQLKYKGKRLHNLRPYVIVGAKYSMDIASQASKTINENERDITIKLYRDDVYAEAGVGFDFYFNRFKMSTELKMSYGFFDVLLNENNIWTDPIERMSSKMFSFNVTFE
ncbi:MAG: PorT family protein [Bacteroidales bacterium]|nr:PorT family protein [Bacteroidales bacterium]